MREYFPCISERRMQSFTHINSIIPPQRIPFLFSLSFTHTYTFIFLFHRNSTNIHFTIHFHISDSRMILYIKYSHKIPFLFSLSSTHTYTFIFIFQRMSKYIHSKIFFFRSQILMKSEEKKIDSIDPRMISSMKYSHKWYKKENNLPKTVYYTNNKTVFI